MIKWSPQKVQLPERTLELAPMEIQSAFNDLAGDVKKLGDAHDAHDDTLSGAIRGGISSANNDLVQFKDVDVDMPTDAPFENLVLVAPWTAVASYTPRILMEPGGRVTTRGAVHDPGGGLGNLFAGGAGYVGPSQRLGLADGATLVVGQFPPELYVADPMGLGLTNFHINATWISSAPRAPHVFPSPWPIIVDHGWKKCLGLFIEAPREISNAAVSMAGAPVPDWEDIGNGQLRLNAVWGLQWGRRYKLRLRLSAEEV